jgi:long-subunit fatty acid transport protein
MGTGGAFIAIADDATAANWNPGGLVQLVKPEMSLVLTVEEKNVDGASTSYNQINHLSMVYPFSVGGVNIVTALNYQRLYDFYYDGDIDEHIQDRNPKPWEIIFWNPGVLGAANQQTDTYDERHVGYMEIFGDIGAVSPAIAVQVTPTFSLGFTYNFWSDGIIGRDYDYAFEQTSSGTYTNQMVTRSGAGSTVATCTCGGGPCAMGMTPDDISCLDVLVSDNQGDFPIDGFEHREEKNDFKAENYNLGLLWKVTPRWAVGGVYRSEFEADVKREGMQETLYTPPTPFESDDKMRFPASYGAGVSFRYSDALSFAADVTRIEWDRFRLKEEDGEKFSPVNGLEPKEAEVDATTSYRLGMEYLVIQPGYVVPIRGGVFYDPEPAYEEPDDYYGVSIGTGLVYEGMVLDLSYWYRWGDAVTISTNVSRNATTGKIMKVEKVEGDIYRQMIMLSAILHFQ